MESKGLVQPAGDFSFRVIRSPAVLSAVPERSLSVLEIIKYGFPSYQQSPGGAEMETRQHPSLLAGVDALSGLGGDGAVDHVWSAGPGRSTVKWAGLRTSGWWGLRR